MIMPPLILHADFDGTLFDPGLKIFLSPAYNQLSVRLMRKHKVLLILNTGRPVWNWFSDVQLAAVGIQRPHAVVLGCGTAILWKKGNRFEKDVEWDAHIRASGWNKEKIKQTLEPLFAKAGIALFETANPYMTRVWVYRKSVVELQAFQRKYEKLLPDTKILLTEQILMPNTTEIFSGYLLFVPRVAGKEQAAIYINKKIEQEYGAVSEKIYVGDASVDVPLLTIDTSPKASSYGIHLVPLARQALINTNVHVLEGSPPRLIYQILTKHLREDDKHHRNSPYRMILTPVAPLLDRLTDATLTPNQISLQGIKYVERAIATSHPGGVYFLMKGYLMDIADGIRARRNPQLTTGDGQLVDVYADRIKEVLQLISRGSYDAALSSLLPSIARAQAEAIEQSVPEHDAAGGSSLSRSLKLIRAYFYIKLGLTNASKRIDQKIHEANMATFRSRRALASSFSWKQIQSYDKKSMERLLLLISLLQQIHTSLDKRNSVFYQTSDKQLQEYLSLKVSNLYSQLNMQTPAFYSSKIISQLK